ncbi:adenosine deaminase [Actinobacillus genomosp. 2]|uniref:adenosine deaminase n=1 Tax=Actinobacillus genomosp. 2 TaxID=230709 RepID=UPI00244287B1|nr:adenosine deaminase [Actinobacillus genomosp. 2]WGE31194.1 adenosine deaminase [Actinobacillus genomosp. 2]
MTSNLAKYGVIDLHLHLDGSLSPEWMIEWAVKQQIQLPSYDPKTLLPFISVPQDCSDLNQYLRCFELPISLLQTPESLASSVTDLLQRLDQMGLLYVEIRFAPQFHTQRDMNQEQAVQAALKGLRDGLAKTRLFKANLILCCMRAADNQAENLETVRLAHKYLSKGEAGVVAVDLAGAEGLYPTEKFAVEFSYANQLGVPFTLHAGEAAGAESVEQALNFGALRIGHGVRSIQSETVMCQLINTRTPLEMCPCSNLQTKTVQHLKDYPLRTFLKRNVVATLNSDNMTVSQTNVKNEFQLLESDYQLTKEEAQQLLCNVIEAAFLYKQDKTALLNEIQQRYPALL